MTKKLSDKHIMDWMMAKHREDMERMDEDYLRYLKQLNNPEKTTPMWGTGIYPMMMHDHLFVATHKTNEHGVLIWECSCGTKTASM